MRKNSNKVYVILSLFTLFICVQAFTFDKKKEEDKFKNLKVLSKKMSGEEMHLLMRNYSKSLGVRCGHCHFVTKGDKPQIDFASDANPKKDIARKMIKMQDRINKRFISRIGDHNLEKITCVTCHMGRIKPIISVDSLAKK